MKIEVLEIQHKTVEDFFRGFYSETNVPVYSYQLRRMFESKAAEEGDLLLFKIDDKPFMHVEFLRTASRRILNVSPRFANALDEEFIKDNIQDVFKKLVECIVDYEEYRSRGLSLIINIDESFKYSSQFKKALAAESRIIDSGQSVLYRLDPVGMDEVEDDELNLRAEKFISHDVDFRYDLISRYDSNVFQYGCNVRDLYQDYIEEGDFGEELWESIYLDNQFVAYIMPLIHNGAVKELVLDNYSIIEESVRVPVIQKILEKVIEMAGNYNSQYLSVTVASDDTDFISLIEKYHGKVMKTVSSYRIL